MVCGSEHCLVLTEDGEVFAWGNGSDGRLGNGKTEWITTPVQICALEGIRVATCRAGYNASALLTDDGQLLAMGSNQYNKLNLAHRQGFFCRERRDEYKDVLVPTMLKTFPARVIDICLGRYHSGVLLESGQVFFFGCNLNCELGIGHAQSVPFGGLRPVKTLGSKACSKIACGDGFSLVGTTENELYFWGSKSADIENSAEVTAVKCDSSLNSNLSRWRKKSGREDERLTQNHLVPLPSLILRLESSKIEQKIYLSNIACAGCRAYVVVDTYERSFDCVAHTHAPPSQSSLEYSEEVNTWLRNELEQAEVIPLRKSEERAPEVKGEPTFISGHNLIERAPYSMQKPRNDNEECTTVTNELETLALMRRHCRNVISIKYPPQKLKAQTTDTVTPLTSYHAQIHKQKNIQLINPLHLHASSSNQSLKLVSDSALMLEIELLKAQIRAQSSTFEGHEIQLAKLQEKLSELQSRQGLLEKSEPPPEYVSQMQSSVSHIISKACVIL